MGMKIFFCVLGLFFAAVPQARAHAVYVDAWVENGLMCAEGSFTGKTKAKNSTVTVVDAQGKTRHEGVTGDEGKICFPLPEKAANLTFILNAGQGHRAETKLYEEDFPVKKSSAPALAQTSPAAMTPAAAPSASAPFSPSAAAPGGANDLPALVREAVRQEIAQEMEPMRKELGAMRQSLAALKKNDPGLLEIFGGIGWIVGLAGAAALAHTRKRKQ